MLRPLLLTCVLAGTGLMAASCNQASGSDTGTSRSELAEEQGVGNQLPAPPQQAVDACKDLAAGAACSVTLANRTVGGTCRKGPDATAPLACVPADRPPPPRFQGPPPEALDACLGRSDNAACTLVLGDKQIDGNCRKDLDGDGQLACVPANLPPPPHGRHGPPPEAFAACESLTEGASCTVALGGRNLEGTCRKGPDGQGELACAPANMPPPPPHGDRPHGPPPEAFAACKSLTEGASCTVALGDESLEGTCRKGPDGQGELACAPANMAPSPPPSHAQ